MFKGISDKTFSEKDFYIDENVAATVMLVSGGYPGNYQKNKLIKGLDECHDSILFHAGTKKVGETYMTNGGRVLAITSFGRDIQHALEKSFKNSEKIDFENKYYRKDIGFDLAPI